MSNIADLLIFNATAVFPDELRPNTWIAIKDGKISAIGNSESNIPEASERLDANGSMLFAGLIDSHAHYREPGLTHKGCIATESRAALVGGISTFFDMPNTKPATLSVADLRHKMELAAASSAINYAFFPAASASLVNDIDTLYLGQIPGIKLFLGTTTGAMQAPDAQSLDRLFRKCAELHLPIMVHAEDDNIIAANAAAATTRWGSREAVPISEHHLIRSHEACLRSTATAVELALRTGARLHIAHISTADEVREFLSTGPIGNKQITAETTPLYLDPIIADPTKRTWRHKVNPAIKTPDDALILREALADGRIDTIGTDHAPHLVEEKQGGEFTAASGAPSQQFALAVMLEYLQPQLIARAMASNPAALFGVDRRGKISVGSYADLILVEKTEAHRISDSDVLTPAGWTPFAERVIHHRVSHVLINGKLAYNANSGFVTEFAAKPVHFNH